MTKNQNKHQIKQQDKIYDLEERTAVFGEDIIKFCRNISNNHVTRPLVSQLVKCSTSIGANYCEADDAESAKDFVHKIGICKKESRETKHFLRMIASAVPDKATDARKLWSEAKEINLIFNSIYKKVKNKNSN